MNTIIRIAALMACAAIPQWAQSWDAVRSVAPGHKVRVETSAVKYTGTMVETTSETVKLQTDGGEVSVLRSDIHRVYAQTKSKRLRNTLIGVGVGVAAGTVLYATLGQWFRNEGAESGGMLAIPTVVGAAVGAVLPTGGMKRIYDAKR